LRLEEALGDQLLVGFHHRSTRDLQGSGEQPRGRQSVAGPDFSPVYGLSQQLRQLAGQVSRTAFECAERGNV
jgi:hypothetical protein